MGGRELTVLFFFFAIAALRWCEGGRENLFRQLPALCLPYPEAASSTHPPPTPLVWIGDAPPLSLRPALTSIDDDWNLSSRARLHQKCDRPLEAGRTPQPHLSCCGILERHARFRISVRLVCHPGALLLHFGLSAEEESPTEGRYSQLLSPPAPNNPRNAGSTVACKTPGTHTGAAQRAHKEMYRSAEFRRHPRPFRLVQLYPSILGESRQFRGVVALGDILIDCRRRGGVHVGNRRVSGRNGAA